MKDFIIIVVLIVILAFFANFFGVVNIPYLDVNFVSEKQYGKEMKETDRLVEEAVK
jgi:uncharacterized protein YneF (UPF0154 family)